MIPFNGITLVERNFVDLMMLVNPRACIRWDNLDNSDSQHDILVESVPSLMSVRHSDSPLSDSLSIRYY